MNNKVCYGIATVLGKHSKDLEINRLHKFHAD